MVNIAFDLEASQPIRGRNHGGAEYTKSVFRELISLSRIDLSENKLFGFYNPEKPLDEEIRSLAEDAKICLIELSDKKLIGDFINRNNIGRLFSGLPYDFDRSLLGDVQFIAAVHGLRGISQSDGQNIRGYARLRSYIRGFKKRILNPKLLLKRVNIRGRQGSLTKIFDERADSDVFVVPCNYTKYSIEKIFGDKFESQIVVNYCPQTKLQRMSADKLDLKNIAVRVRALQFERFILSLNIDRQEKNVEFSVNGFVEYIRTTNDSLIYVLVGKPTKKMLNLTKQITANVIFLDELNLYDLAFLYSKCQCLVYPSISEGFGYPPIECMSFGSPVLASVNTSLSEIFYRSAIFFNPTNVVDFQHKLQFILDRETNSALRKEMTKMREPIVSRQNRDLTYVANIILKGKI